MDCLKFCAYLILLAMILVCSVFLCRVLHSKNDSTLNFEKPTDTVDTIELNSVKNDEDMVETACSITAKGIECKLKLTNLLKDEKPRECGFSYEIRYPWRLFNLKSMRESPKKVKIQDKFMSKYLEVQVYEDAAIVAWLERSKSSFFRLHMHTVEFKHCVVIDTVVGMSQLPVDSAIFFNIIASMKKRPSEDTFFHRYYTRHKLVYEKWKALEQNIFKKKI